MRFKVVGNHEVDGVATGGTVVIDDEARARWLTRAGHIEVPKKAPAKRKDEKDEEVPDGDPGLD